MLKECVEVFKCYYDKKKDRLITDDYIPSNGTYVLIHKENDKLQIKDVFDINHNKKTKEVKGRENFNYQKICEFDYYSKLINMNKPIDMKKKIHSNNYLSFFVKKEVLQKNELNNEIIDNYYEILKNPYLKYKKPKAKELYELTEQKLQKIDLNLLEEIKEYIKSIIFDLEKLEIDISQKDYLKIFFDCDINLYKNEGERYLIPNVFNNNDYNQKIENTIYGLSNDNMNLNVKKPFLENKTRKIVLPNLISYDDALVQKKFFDYLYNQASQQKYNIYIDIEKNEISCLENKEHIKADFRGYYLRIKKDTEVKIVDFDIISSYKFKLEPEFKVFEFIQTNEEHKKDYYKTIKNKEEFQTLINELVFNKFLVNNYFANENEMSIKDNNLKKNILFSRNKIFNYIYKNDKVGLYEVLEKVLSSSVIENILNKNFIKATNQYNLKLSLKKYFKGEESLIYEIKNNLRQKINSNQTQMIENDFEYCFAVGQFVSYLISKSKSKNVPNHLINNFLNAKSDKVIKQNLMNLYKKYNYDENINSKRTKNLYAMILSYNLQNKVCKDSILAGFLHSSLIYEKGDGSDE